MSAPEDYARGWRFWLLEMPAVLVVTVAWVTINLGVQAWQKVRGEAA